MRRLLSGVLALFSLSALALDVRVGVGPAVVTMGHLNTVIQAMAERQGATYVPLRIGWEGHAGAALVQGIGLCVFGIGASGGIPVRPDWGQSAMAVGGELFGSVSLRSLGVPLGVDIGVGIGGCWAAASGLVVGQGVGWGGTLLAQGKLLSLGPLRMDLRVCLRYLVVPSIRDGERVIDTGGVTAMDFSGAGVGLELRWTR